MDTMKQKATTESVEISSWAEYSSAIAKIKSRYGNHKFLGDGKEVENTILYRGQPNAEKGLETSLEHISDKIWSVNEYARCVESCQPIIESFTNHRWNLSSVDALITELEDHMTLPDSDYSFWSYLRQHGFPSPLLDWTRSQYIGAFFAAATTCEEADKVAVFAYVEQPEGGKYRTEGKKTISVQGPYARTDRRHYVQQSWYTFCTECIDGEYQFTSHEDVFACRKYSQDILVKIIIPKTERLKMLRDLRVMNISQLSLFQTEEALMRTLAFDEIERYEI